jgi:ATP-binding cassette, subfamily B, bacterial
MTDHLPEIDDLTINPQCSLKNTNGLVTLKRLLAQARGFHGHIVGVFFLSLLAAPLSLLAPFPVKLAIDCVLGEQPVPGFVSLLIPASVSSTNQGLITFSAISLVAIAALQYLRGIAEGVLASYTSENLVLRFRSQLLDHVQRLSLRFHDAKGSSESLYRIQNDATALEGVVLQGLVPVATAIFTLIAMIYVTARIDATLTLIALGACPVLLLWTVLFRKRLRAQWTAVKEAESSVLGVVHEVLASLRVVKAFGREAWEVSRFEKQARHVRSAKLYAVFSEGCFSMLIGVTVAIGTATVLYVGVGHVEDGSLTLGNLILVMLYLVMLYQPLETIGVRFASLQSALASAERVFALLDSVPDVQQNNNAIALTRAQGSIVFSKVSFGYEPQQPILRNCSFTVPAGARVGIIGRTGAGKTTLVNLLPRFQDPTQGQVLLDGVDLRDYRLADLRRQFSIVLQDSMLFSTTIEENIAYGRPEADHAEIVLAAQVANAHDFIMRLPEGYQTQVGERGMRLSGGERQRIALARAFLRNAPILILDEPTSSVDVKTENLVMEALEQLMAGRTTFLISHRPNTLANCDLLLRVEQGSLVAVDPVSQIP